MDPNNPYETWQAVIEKVKSYGTVNPAQVDAFLGRMQPQASSVGFLLATVDTDFIKGQIESSLSFANRAGRCATCSKPNTW